MHNKFLKYYFINKFNKNHLEKLNKDTKLIFRNYKSKNYINDLNNLIKFCNKKGFDLYLSNNFKLALKLGLKGVYLPSFNKTLFYNCYKFRNNFEILGSAHNINEINQKSRQKVQKLFISPVFKEKNNRQLGFYRLKYLSKFVNCSVVALGGISQINLKRIYMANVDGFAGIKFFSKKKAPKKGP